MKAEDIMTSNVVAVRPSTPIVETIDLLVDHAISGLPVVDDDNNVVGIVSEYDLIFKRKLPVSPLLMYHYGEYTVEKIPDEHKKKLCEAKVEDIMEKNVICVEEKTPVKDIVNLMVEKRVKRIPIVRDKKLVGIVSRRDVLKELFRLVCWT